MDGDVEENRELEKAMARMCRCVSTALLLPKKESLMSFRSIQYG